MGGTPHAARGAWDAVDVDRLAFSSAACRLQAAVMQWRIGPRVLGAFVLGAVSGASREPCQPAGGASRQEAAAGACCLLPAAAAAAAAAAATYAVCRPSSEQYYHHISRVLTGVLACWHVC